MKQKIYEGTLLEGQGFELMATTTKKYTLSFSDIGMAVEFTMLAGQVFRISGLKSNVIVDMQDVEPEIPGGGLQLVPSAQRH